MAKLLLLLDTMYYYDREVLKGIKAKIDESQLKLSIHIESIENVDAIVSQHWDHVIIDFDKADRHRVIPRLKSNVLIYSSYKIDHIPEGVSTLVNDNEQFACLALGHFIQNDIQNVAFYLDPCEENAGWANERQQYFEKNAALLGLNYFHDVKKSVASRPFPLGVYCASDRGALRLVNFCLGKNISVPNQISIIGTDYDDAERALSPMPLSSINVDPYLLGQRCVEVLFKASRFNRKLHEKYQPINLMNGKSTPVDDNQDDIVNKALYFLYNNYHLNINVHQVIDFCRVSRKTLDNRFIASKGMTVHQYLSNLRLKKSKKLLRNSTDSIEGIALQCGYPNQSYLYQVYRKQFNYTPCEYRNSNNLI